MSLFGLIDATVATAFLYYYADTRTGLAILALWAVAAAYSFGFTI